MTTQGTTVRNGAISTVIGGLILAAVLKFVPHAWDLTCHGVGKLIDCVAAVILHFMSSSEVPHWAIYLLAAFSLPTIFWAFARLFGRNAKEDPSHAYRGDTFFNIRWKWAYDCDQSPIAIWGECPQCRTDVVYSYDIILNRTEFACETCNKTLVRLDGNKDYVISKVARQIERKIRTGEWKDAQDS